MLVALGIAISLAVSRGVDFPMISFGWAILAITGSVMRMFVVLWFKRRQIRFRAMYTALIAVSFCSWCAFALFEPPASMHSATWLVIHSAWIPYLNQSPQVVTMFAPPPYR